MTSESTARALLESSIAVSDLAAPRGNEVHCRVRHGGEPLGRPAAHALRGRVGRHEVRVGLLERSELPHQRVELGVGDLGVVVDVVALFVVADQAT